MTTRRLHALFLVATAAASAAAVAQTYPAKPLRLVVPYTPGASNDTLSRATAQSMAPILGQGIVIDNRPGAGGMIGAENVARAEPDGYTILNVQASFATNVAIRAKMPYDVFRDFAYIGMMTRSPMIVVVHPSLPVRSVKELVVLAKRRPGELNYGSSGTGGSNHLATELFAKAAGIRIVHVPYKSIGPAIVDLVGGNVQLVITSLPSALVQVKAGRIKALGVASEKRSSFAPDIPTVSESGVPYVSELWWGLAAPGKTPPEIVNRLSDALRKAMQTPQLKEQYAREGGEPLPMTPPEFTQYVFTEVNRWRQVVKDAGLQLE
ncbi:MAG: tripartite tricarboxylate transporter family receptor [Betaproteobacteria bacterium]|jgi:tripartite-type tricarboxylate transporter receptor subunit TctC|nr:tripartite tricarboxylate transporter family receptor [Betaproteobacteria bacterium]